MNGAESITLRKLIVAAKRRGEKVKDIAENSKNGKRRELAKEAIRELGESY